MVVGAVCALGVIFAPQLVHLMAPGFAAVPGKFELAVSMTRIMFPFLLLVALAAQAMGVLNASNKFGVPAMASTFFNIGSVGFGVVLGIWLGPSLHLTRIEGMAIGVVLGGALQLVWQLPALYRLGFRFRVAFDWKHPGLVRIFRLMVPAILGNAAVQINVMVNTNFASTIADPVRGMDGPVSWLSYAFRFMQLPLGLFGVAMASATLPSISRSAAAGNMDEFRRTLSKSLGMVFLLTLPSSVGLAVLGKSIIGAIYQGGRFQLYDTQQTALALSCYAIGLAGYAALKVLNPAFYALGDARTPMLVSLGSIVINFATAATMIRFAGLGHAGLALSTSVVALFGFFLLFEILRRRIGGVHGRELAARNRQSAARVAGDGGCDRALQPRRRTLAGRFATGSPGRSGDLDPRRSAGLLRHVPGPRSARSRHGHPRLHRPRAPPVPAENRALILRHFSTDKGCMSGLVLVLYLLAADPARIPLPLAITCSGHRTGQHRTRRRGAAALHAGHQTPPGQSGRLDGARQGAGDAGPLSRRDRRFRSGRAASTRRRRTAARARLRLRTGRRFLVPPSRI